jgi:hypothetical protein
LLELSSFDGERAGGAALLADRRKSDNIAEAQRAFDYIRLGENSVLAGLGGFKSALATGLETQLLNLNAVRSTHSQFTIGSARHMNELASFRETQAPSMARLGMNGLVKALATVGVVWAAEKVVDSRLFKDEPIRAGTLVADMVASPAIAFMPGSWIVKGAGMFAAHMAGRYVDTKFGH